MPDVKITIANEKEETTPKVRLSLQQGEGGVYLIDGETGKYLLKITPKGIISMRSCYGVPLPLVGSGRVRILEEMTDRELT